jgi:hypothetical protein
MKRFVLLSLMALFAAFSIAAKENYKEQAVKADTKEAFTEVAATVRKEMEDGGRYEYVNAKERVQVEKNLDAMGALFDKYGTVQAMTEQSKIELFNAQESVNSVLTLRDRDRVICKKEAPLGSHIPTVSCHTYGQAEDARRGTQRQLDDWKHPACVGGGCGGG